MSKTFIAVSTILGGIIGAGFLAIPYVVMKSGFGIGLFYLILLGIILGLVTLYLGEIVLRTKTNHQLSGYAEKYLGKKGKILMFISLAFGIYAAILAYLIGEGQSLSYLFFSNSNYQIHFAIILWVLVSLISYFGLKALEDGETIGMILIAVLIVSIIIFAWNKIDVSNLTYNNFSYAFLPFGVILFAYLGFSIIPEVGRILGKEKREMKRSIIISYVLCFIVYAAFTAVVLGFKGSLTPQIATLGLGKPFILLGIVTMFTAYLGFSIALMDNLRFDFKFKKTSAWLITIIIPMILFILLQLFNKVNFTLVLAIGGVISGGFSAIVILLMNRAAKKLGERHPEYSIPLPKILFWIISLIFIIATIAEVILIFLK